MYILVFFLVVSAFCEWGFEWIGGPEGIVDGKPSFSKGGSGSFSSSYYPSIRINFEVCEMDGRVFLFGGRLPVNTGDYGYEAFRFNDLWEYNVDTEEYAWWGGSATNESTFFMYNSSIPQTRYTFDRSNWPAGVYNHRIVCSDSQLYLVGGKWGWTDTDSATDYAWTFDLASMQWAWIFGMPLETIDDTILEDDVPLSDEGAYTKGEFYEANWETHSWSLRYKHALAYYDGIVYMYGGNVVYQHVYNDLWAWDVSNNELAYLEGSITEYNLGPLYPPTKGVFNGTVTPGGRMNHYMWNFGGSLFLYGGWSSCGYCLDGVSYYDIWEYEISQGEWRWLSGYNHLQTEEFSLLDGMPEEKNVWVDAEVYYRNAWTSGFFAASNDEHGLVLFFGGESIQNQVSVVHANDLGMLYSTKDNLFLWLGGSDESSSTGVYNNKGELNATSYPPGRQEGVMVYRSSDKKFYMFGGTVSMMVSPREGNYIENFFDWWAIYEWFPSDPEDRPTFLSSSFITVISIFFVLLSFLLL